MPCNPAISVPLAMHVRALDHEPGTRCRVQLNRNQLNTWAKNIIVAKLT